MTSASAHRPSPTRIQTSSYCLYCYSSIETTRGVSQRCPRCGRRHSKAEHEAYWSREPRLRAIESLIKTLIVAGMAVLILAIIGELGPDGAPVILFFIGPIVWLGGALFWTAGLITRRPRYFSAKLLWVGSITLYVVGTPILMFVLDVIARRESFGADYWRSYLLLVSPAVPLAMLAAGLRWFGGWFETFKRERLEQGFAEAHSGT